MKRHNIFLILLIFSTAVFGQNEHDSAFLKKEQQLSQDRYRVLINTYYNRNFDKNNFQKKVLILDTSINMNKVYQAIFNLDSTRFIAFFLFQVIDSNLLKIPAVLAPGEIVTYQYLVCGIKYNNNWYYNPTWYGYNTVFLAKTIEDRKKDFLNQLQDYNFFKENSTEFNPKFWESELFNKIKVPGHSY